MARATRFPPRPSAAPDSEPALRAALAADPSDAHAAQLLAVQCAERGDLDEAIDLFERVAAAAGAPAPQTFGVHSNLANAYRRAGRLDDAEDLLRALVRVAPDAWQPWHNLAQVLKDRGAHHEAVAVIRRAIALGPDFAANHAVLGELLHKLGRYHSSLGSLHRALALGSDRDPDVWTYLGNTYRQLGQLDEAVAPLERVVDLTGGAPMAHSNVGIVCAQLGDFERARREFETAMELDPDRSTIKANAAYGYLTAGDLTAGWELWEHGLEEGGPRGRRRSRAGALPFTPADPGRRVLVYREQGVGDEILFSSAYPDLIEHAAATGTEVVIESDPRLVTLMRRSFPGAEVRTYSYHPTHGEQVDPPDFDRIVASGSLPGFFRRSIDDFPSRRALLTADPARVGAWRERLAGHPRPIIGCSWRSMVRTAERRLEYTQLREWGELFAVPGVSWVNLQYDDCEPELTRVERELGVEILRWSWLDLKDDFEEVAALMCNLDLVVAPRNAVAMLAGALDVPTVMTGNAWDWSDLGAGTFPWFRSVELAVREHRTDWATVLSHAADRVREVAGLAAPLREAIA